jgi:hypothetical protein
MKIGSRSSNSFAGGYSPEDGTIEFYSRIQSLLNVDFELVLNVGAGRGSWYYEDCNSYRRELLTLKGKVRKYIGIDIDPIVLTNPTTDINYIMINELFPIGSDSVDLVISDWVLEHTLNPSKFSTEISRVLKRWFFCARTPHKYNYISIFANLLNLNLHRKILSFLQPSRKSIDTFATNYKLNTNKSLKEHFSNFNNFTYIYVPEPSYHFDNKLIYKSLMILHKFLPRSACGYLYVFVEKK